MGKFFSTSQTPIVDFKYKVPVEAIAMGLKGRQDTWNQEESLIDESFQLVDQVKHITGTLGEEYGDVEAAQSLQNKYDSLLEQGLSEIGDDYSKAGKLRRKIEQEVRRDFGANGLAGALESRYADLARRQEYGQKMIQDGGWDNADYQNYLSQGTPLESASGYNSSLSNEMWGARAPLHELLPNIVSKMPDTYKQFMQLTPDGKFYISAQGKDAQEIKNYLTGYLQSVPGFNEWFQRDLQSFMSSEYVSDAAVQRIDMASQFEKLIEAEGVNSPNAEYYQEQIDTIMDPNVSDEEFNLRYRAQKYIDSLVDPYVEGFAGISNIDIRNNPDYEHDLRMAEINHKNRLDRQSIILSNPLMLVDNKANWKTSDVSINYIQAKESLETLNKGLDYAAKQLVERAGIRVDNPSEFLNSFSNLISNGTEADLLQFKKANGLSDEQYSSLRTAQDSFSRTQQEVSSRATGLENLRNQTRNIVKEYVDSQATDEVFQKYFDLYDADYDTKKSVKENVTELLTNIILGDVAPKKIAAGKTLFATAAQSVGFGSTKGSVRTKNEQILPFQEEILRNIEGFVNNNPNLLPSKRLIGFTDLNNKSELNQYTTLMTNALNVNKLKGKLDIYGNDAQSVLEAEVGEGTIVKFNVMPTIESAAGGNPLIYVSYTYKKDGDDKTGEMVLQTPQEWYNPMVNILKEVASSGTPQESSYASQGLGSLALNSAGITDLKLETTPVNFFTYGEYEMKIIRNNLGGFEMEQRHKKGGPYLPVTSSGSEIPLQFGDKSSLKDFLGRMLF